jgi:poly-gamma-glutamate synthesis protein (capsule biosynthesis protein)
MKRLPALSLSLLLLAACAPPSPRKKKEPPPEVPPPINRLLFGGDVMLARNVGQVITAKRDPAWPFRQIATDFARADLAFVNLESPFTDQGKPTTSGMVFRADPANVAGLTLAGIDVVSFANNHSRDAHEHGLLYTLDLLEKNKIAVAGAARTEAAARAGVILERQGVRFGFLAYTYDQRNGNHKTDDPRINILDLVRLREDIAALRARANVTIISLHAGLEYAKKPNVQQRQMAQAAIEAGASLVIGHHPHVTQPCEDYRTGVICYSLGNLVFDQTIPGTNDGAIVEAEFKGPSLRKVRLRKIRIQNTQPVFVQP